jgi:hypothetical protein
MPLRRSPVSDPSEMKSLREVSLRTFAAVLLLASPMTAETADAVLERAAAIRWEPVSVCPVVAVAPTCPTMAAATGA